MQRRAIEFWKEAGRLVSVGLMSVILLGVALTSGAKVQPAGRPLLFGLSFSCDSRWVVTCGDKLRLFDVRSGEQLKRLEAKPDQRSRSVAFSPTDAELLAVGFESGVIQLRRIGVDRPVRQLQGHNSTVQHLTFSPDGLSLVSVSTDYMAVPAHGRLNYWNVADGAMLHGLHCKGETLGASFSGDGKRLAFCSGNRIEVMDVESWDSFGSAELPHGRQTGDPFGIVVRFASNDERIYVAGGTSEPAGEGFRAMGLLWKVTLDDPSSVDLISGPFAEQFRRSIAVTPDGTRVVTGYCQRSDGHAIQHITMFEVAEDKSLWTTLLEAAPGGIIEPFGMQISPDGKLIGWCNAGQIELNDVQTGRPVRTLKLLDP
jgi:WD40 repeat protein